MPVKKLTIQVIHGPNLNLLGEREKNIYGAVTLSEIDGNLKKIAKSKDVTLKIFQSNHEGEIIDVLHAAKTVDGILINPAAFTHTSVAIRDALIAVKKPIVEVHLSNIYAREDFRHHSFISDIAVGVISGFGAKSYDMGLAALITHLAS
jgi:3-dehydroquinate dehydratase-2